MRMLSHKGRHGLWRPSARQGIAKRPRRTGGSFHDRNFFLVDAFHYVTHRRLAETDIVDETGDAIGLGRVLQLECDEMKKKEVQVG